MSNFHLSSTLGQQFAASYTTTDRKSSEHGANPRRTVDALAHYLETDGSLKGARMRLSETQEETAGLWSIGKTPERNPGLKRTRTDFNKVNVKTNFK
jgi:hypothetical protein